MFRKIDPNRIWGGSNVGLDSLVGRDRSRQRGNRRSLTLVPERVVKHAACPGTLPFALRIGLLIAMEALPSLLVSSASNRVALSQNAPALASSRP